MSRLFSQIFKKVSDMVTLQRTANIQAFHYIRADEIDVAEAVTHSYAQWDRIERELPELEIYDVVVLEEDAQGPGQNEEGPETLTIIQRWYNEDGERSNISHELRPEDWLVTDFTAEGGYRVLTPPQLQDFLQGN